MSSPVSILLVEDNDGDAHLVREHLASAPLAFDVTHVVRLRDAMAALYRRPHDLVLLDLSLPDSSGLRTLEKLRQSTPGVPVVVLTGTTDDELGVASVQAGAQDYLVKDEVDARSLVRAIRFALERSAAVSETQRFQQQYALWIQQSGDGLWDWDLSSNQMTFSPGWAELLGLESDALQGRPDEWFDRVHRDDASTLANIIDEHLEGGDPTFRIEHRLQRGDGSWRWFEARGIAVRDVAGHAVRVAGSMRDLTEMRRGRCVACAEVNDPRAAVCHRCGAPLAARARSSQQAGGGEWPPGTVVDDRYRIAQLLAVGSSATVYEAFDRTADRAVALKVLHRWLVDDPATMQRFLTEGRIQQDLDDPHIVRVHEVIQTPETAIAVMEFVRGATLREWLLSTDADGDPQQVVALLAPLIESIGRVHALGVVHRDIKPENILVTRHERRVVAKLADFGIAKLASAPSKTRTGAAMGTLHYMAPEQFIDAKSADHRADIYALGCTIFEALTRRPPFEASSEFGIMTAHLGRDVPSARALNPLASHALDAVLARALAKDPTDRFENAAALANALRDAV